MLIIANGAFRSGSTWVANILRSMIEYSKIPKRYDNTKDWGTGNSIHPNKLKAFIKEVNIKDKFYISKNHFGKKKYRNLILKSDHVVVINVHREIKDAVTSGYYYFYRRGEFSGSFKEYYWKRGRYVADSLRNYHKVWETESPIIYKTSYEKLKQDYFAEVKKIGSFVGLSLSDFDVKRIQENTNINRLREKWNEKDKEEKERFFRKGVIGDWRNHFDDEMIENIQEIEKKGLSSFERYRLKAKFKSLDFINSMIRKN